jgi:hydrogenase nickel incorporation protein HypA/HybF
MIEQIEESLKKETFNSVNAINIKIGKISGIDPSSFDFCFESSIKGTILEGSKLNIDVIPYKIKCNKCSKEEILDDFSHVCPSCLSTDIKILTGQELKIINLEVE